LAALGMTFFRMTFKWRFTRASCLAAEIAAL
jgi:hypothetical protein